MLGRIVDITSVESGILRQYCGSEQDSVGNEFLPCEAAAHNPSPRQDSPLRQSINNHIFSPAPLRIALCVYTRYDLFYVQEPLHEI